MNGTWRRIRLGSWLLLIVCCGLTLVASDRRLVYLTRNTAVLAAAVAGICLPLGTLIALLLARTNLPGRRVLGVIVATLLVLPLYLQAAAWDAGFGRLGWYSLAQEAMATPWLSGWLAAIWIHSMAALPWVVLFVAVITSLSDPELEEAALLDGSTSQVFIHVTLRRAVPGIILAAMWIVLTTAGEMMVTDIYSIRTLAEELYTSHAFGDGLFSQLGMKPALLGTMILAVMTAMVVIRFAHETSHVPTRPPWLFDLGRWKWPIAFAMFVFLCLLVVIPLGNLVYKAGLVVEQVGADRVRTWSLSKFTQLVLPLPSSHGTAAIWRFRRELSWTFVIGITTATLSLLIAAPLAWLARRGGYRALPAVLVSSLSLAMPGPLVGFVVLRLLTLRSGSWAVWLCDRTILGPVLAICWRSLPLTLLICWAAFSTVSRSLNDLAITDGAGPLARFWFVGVRLRLPALAVAWFVSLVVACGDLSTSILVLPPGVTNVPIRVFGLLHYGVDDQVAAICLTNAAGFFVMTIMIVGLCKLSLRRGS